MEFDVQVMGIGDASSGTDEDHPIRLKYIPPITKNNGRLKPFSYLKQQIIQEDCIRQLSTVPDTRYII